MVKWDYKEKKKEWHMLAPFLTLLFMVVGCMCAFPNMEILENEAKAFCNL